MTLATVALLFDESISSDFREGFTCEVLISFFPFFFSSEVVKDLSLRVS